MHTPSSHDLYAHHPRHFAANQFVYPVLSRRAGGISIGVNLNPDKICNFDCVYCQVDRKSPPRTRSVDTERLLQELDEMLRLVTSSEIFATSEFRNTPPPFKRLNDIAFSGDGEPTTHEHFDEIAAACAALKKKHRLPHVKMILITNATMLHRPHVQLGLQVLDENNGEIWAKLEAGTEEYYRLIERTTIPFAKVLRNIKDAAIQRPLVIQSLFMRVHGNPPATDEQEAFCSRLNEITAQGGRLELVQVYTVARSPAESYVTPLRPAEVDALVNRVESRTGIPAQGFYGSDSLTG